jgi:hypothetical protein
VEKEIEKKEGKEKEREKKGGGGKEREEGELVAGV